MALRRKDVEDRVLGAVVGATMGDAVGGAFEMWPAEYIRKRIGKDWIDDMYDYARGSGSFGVWSNRTRKGTGTDDTRMNHVLLEAVIENKGEITSQRLAMAYIDRYVHAERHYPKRHFDMARAHFQDFYGVSCGHLGMECPLHPGVPPYALRARSFGCRFPTLIGLLSLSCAGCLYADQPVEAYKKAFELSYFDVGYAPEICGLLAAAVSMAVGGVTDMGRILKRLGKLDPFEFNGSRFGGSMNKVAGTARTLARKAKSPGDLSVLLSRELMKLHVFDPIDTLTVCLASNAYAEDDPREAILIGSNHRNVDADGNLVSFRDNDCTGYVTGALAGALAGFKRLPSDWAEHVLVNNKKAYSIDMEKNVRAFCDVVYG